MENIIIANKKELEKKIEKIRDGGKENIHIISDFDRTLTYGTVDGEKTPSLIAALRDDDYLGEDYSKRAKALYEHYHKIEMDSEMLYQDKKEKMKEWWESHLALLTEKGLKKEHLERVAKKTKVSLRKGVVNFLDKLKKNNIPIVIFSASGCGEAVEIFFKEKGVDYENVFFLVNRFYWSDDGVAMGAKDPKIHILNKDETLVKEQKDIFESIKDRKNVILFGDNIGDAKMTDGFNYDTVIKIGFLNDDYNNKKELETYKECYDVVVIGDADFNILDDNFLGEVFNSQ